MEEDIKILEEILNRDIEDTEGTKIMKKAIKNLIARYKELEEENREIKKEFALNTEIHKRDEIIKDLKETINCLHEIDKENYIPKSKVKEKIEEYNIPIFDILDKLPIMPRTIERGCGAKDGIIYVLQELLGE